MFSNEGQTSVAQGAPSRFVPHLGLEEFIDFSIIFNCSVVIGDHISSSHNSSLLFNFCNILCFTDYLLFSIASFGSEWLIVLIILFSNVICSSKLSEDLQQTSHLFFYLADEDGNALSPSRDLLDMHDNSLLAFGSRKDIGSWHLHLASMVCWQIDAQ